MRRCTPFHRAHSTEIVGAANIIGSDNRFHNNLFTGPLGIEEIRKRKGISSFCGLWVYNASEFPLQTSGNVYLNGARPYGKEVDAVVKVGFDPEVKLVGHSLQLTLDDTLQKAKAKLVTTELLGQAKIPGLPYENPDGTPLEITTDYFGKERDPNNPTPGPFEKPGSGQLVIKLKEAIRENNDATQ
jgi:hypothetical protein